jgi:hypothetical protein
MATGGSYGGQMTLAVATQYDSRTRASLAVVAMSNLTFLERTPSPTAGICGAWSTAMNATRRCGST